MWHRWKGEKEGLIVELTLTDLDWGEKGVRGDSKVSTGMFEWPVISLTERERIAEGPWRGLSWEAGELRIMRSVMDMGDLRQL